MLYLIQVEQDGSLKLVDASSRGGRTFHGLGTQLTGYKVICPWYLYYILVFLSNIFGLSRLLSGNVCQQQSCLAVLDSRLVSLSVRLLNVKEENE